MLLDLKLVASVTMVFMDIHENSQANDVKVCLKAFFQKRIEMWLFKM